jgi:hypothetical protein
MNVFGSFFKIFGVGNGNGNGRVKLSDLKELQGKLAIMSKELHERITSVQLSSNTTGTQVSEMNARLARWDEKLITKEGVRADILSHALDCARGGWDGSERRKK